MMDRLWEVLFLVSHVTGVVHIEAVHVFRDLRQLFIRSYLPVDILLCRHIFSCLGVFVSFSGGLSPFLRGPGVGTGDQRAS